MHQGLIKNGSKFWNRFVSDSLTWLRDQDSNLGPRGYEPRELPLLHPASNVFSLFIIPNRGDIVNCCSGGVGRNSPTTQYFAGKPVV
ncbi:MAG: hypothetical protein JWO35_217 [Candidatus Saccharibacteria bacterium]|nr:hypothetical protein [Candidatus Saccharibacteria bacterium]